LNPSPLNGISLQEGAHAVLVDVIVFFLVEVAVELSFCFCFFCIVICIDLMIMVYSNPFWFIQFQQIK